MVSSDPDLCATYNCNYKPNSVCSITDGKPFCKCQTGFLSVGYDCKDENECRTGEKKCHQICINKLGTYECKCYWNYRLQKNGETCEEIPLLLCGLIVVTAITIIFIPSISCLYCLLKRRMDKNKGDPRAMAADSPRSTAEEHIPTLLIDKKLLSTKVEKEYNNEDRGMWNDLRRQHKSHVLPANRFDMPRPTSPKTLANALKNMTFTFIQHDNSFGRGRAKEHDNSQNDTEFEYGDFLDLEGSEVVREILKRQIPERKSQQMDF